MTWRGSSDAEADMVALAFVSAMLQMGAVEAPGRWMEYQDQVLACFSGAPAAEFNSIITDSINPDPRPLARQIGRIAGAGVPFCVELRAEPDRQVLEVLRSHGLRREDELIPLMLLRDADGINAVAKTTKLRIREVQPTEAATYAVAMSRGFEGAEEVMLGLNQPQDIEAPGRHSYLGDVGGVTVATAMSVTTGDLVGIFNISTLRSHRGRGYGTAITVHAVRQALREGARHAWLQSSRAGYPVYARLGFRTVEYWNLWTHDVGA